MGQNVDGGLLRLNEIRRHRRLLLHVIRGRGLRLDEACRLLRLNEVIRRRCLRLDKVRDDRGGVGAIGLASDRRGQSKGRFHGLKGFGLFTHEILRLIAEERAGEAALENVLRTKKYRKGNFDPHVESGMLPRTC